MFHILVGRTEGKWCWCWADSCRNAVVLINNLNLFMITVRDPEVFHFHVDPRHQSAKLCVAFNHE